MRDAGYRIRRKRTGNGRGELAITKLPKMSSLGGKPILYDMDWILLYRSTFLLKKIFIKTICNH